MAVLSRVCRPGVFRMHPRTDNFWRSFLTLETINADVKRAQYAVRGELVIRANAHQHAIEAGETRPFKRLTYCNIGNPHELRQKPITFFRQVLAMTVHPELAETPESAKLFPPDAIARAKRYNQLIPGGTGACMCAAQRV